MNYYDKVKEHGLKLSTATIGGGKRLDAGDEDGHWVTTENGHHLFINGEGEPTKGNPHVLSAAKGESPAKKTSSAKAGEKASSSSAPKNKAAEMLSEHHTELFNKTMMKDGPEFAASAHLKKYPAGTVCEGETAFFKKGDDGKWQMSQDGKKYDPEHYPDSFVANVLEAGHTSVIIPEESTKSSKETEKTSSGEKSEKHEAPKGSKGKQKTGRQTDSQVQDSYKKAFSKYKNLASKEDERSFMEDWKAITGKLPFGTTIKSRDWTFRKEPKGRWSLQDNRTGEWMKNTWDTSNVSVHVWHSYAVKGISPEVKQPE